MSTAILQFVQSSFKYSFKAATKATLAAAGVPRQPSVVDATLSLSRKSWCWDSVRWFNQLPVDILAEKKMIKFKTRLNDWVEKNV
jgi:hypothetical protein